MRATGRKPLLMPSRHEEHRFAASLPKVGDRQQRGAAVSGGGCVLWRPMATAIDSSAPTLPWLHRVGAHVSRRDRTGVPYVSGICW